MTLKLRLPMIRLLDTSRSGFPSCWISVFKGDDFSKWRKGLADVEKESTWELQ